MYNPTGTVRMNISLPTSLVMKLKEAVPSRGISAFLTDAIREKIAQIEKEQALQELLDSPASFQNISNASAHIHAERTLDAQRE